VNASCVRVRNSVCLLSDDMPVIPDLEEELEEDITRQATEQTNQGTNKRNTKHKKTR
jgi:hypothetical protein